MAKIREIEVGLGISVDKKGVWVKGNAKVTVTVDDSDDIAACFKRAFELTDGILNEKMEEYLGEEETDA